ncbi:hypothetical protein Tco_0908123 [Tanacetum coccineum]|uniref:Uncharacterized protein n=1 Tax=Tanacetum coccineum TaxID=301880 RepID=A0ABQ5CM16_9ASTR
MDVSGRLEGEFYPTYLTLLAGRRWLLTHGIHLALLKCLKSSEYQGILGHALGQAVDFGMQEGLEAGHKHGVARRSLAAVDAYNPDAAKAKYVDAVQALEDPCIEQLLIPIHHPGEDRAAGETSLSFALMNVHSRAEGAKRHAAALRRSMVDIVFAPLSSQTWMGEASTFAAPLSIEDYDAEDTDEILGCVVAIPELEPCRFIFHVRGSSFPLRSLSLYAPFPSAYVTLFGPFHLGPSFLVSSTRLASLLRSFRERSSYVDALLVEWPWGRDWIQPFLRISFDRIPLKMVKRSDFRFIALAFFCSAGKVLSVSSLTSTCLLRCTKMVDAILLSASAFLFPLLGTCLIENSRKALLNVFTFSKYLIISVSFAM